MNPVFTVVIPSYNRAGILERAIKSVLKQGFQDWEVILVDDGSTDDTRQIVLPYLDDPRFSYVSQTNAGVSSARNHGARVAGGEWLVFLDSDDELTPDALAFFTKSIESNPKTSVITAGIILKGAKKRTVLLPDAGKYIGHIPGSFAIKKLFFLDLGGYDGRLKFAENTELFFRIGSSGKSPTILDKPTVCYFDNENGGSKNLKNSTDSTLLILQKHRDKLPKSTKRLYHQIVGVNFMRFQEYEKAKDHLAKAFWLNPKKLDTLGRLIIACVPYLAKKLYPIKSIP